MWFDITFLEIVEFTHRVEADTIETAKEIANENLELDSHIDEVERNFIRRVVIEAGPTT